MYQLAPTTLFTHFVDFIEQKGGGRNTSSYMDHGNIFILHCLYCISALFDFLQVFVCSVL